MEDQRDQQATPTPHATPYAPMSQDNVRGSQHQGAPPASTVERVTRLALRRVAYGLVVAGRLIRPRLGWVLLSLFLVGVIGIETIALIAPLFVARMADNRPPAIPVSAAVESFLQAQASYDAEMMWESFSPQFQASLIDHGTSKDQLVAKVKRSRDGGQKYTRFSYVGGIALQGDQKMYFYAVDVISGQTNQSDTVSFVFTVDKSGKITSIH